MPPSKNRNLLLTVLGLLIFFGLALNTALAKAPTVDESVHLLRGYALWQTDDLRLQSQPPLSHWLIGALLFIESDLPDVTALESWDSNNRPLIADEFVWHSNLDIDRLFFLARLPMIFLALLVGSMMLRWAGEYIHRSSQPLLLALFAFSPNLLAFSSLATTDLTVVATYLATIFTLWRYRQKPSWRRWLWASACLGLALSAKLTAILLLPITLLLSYIPRPGRARWWQPGFRWLLLFPLAGLILWGSYRFEVRPIPGLTVPVPAATYISNFLRVQDHIEGGHHAFLLGERSAEGWWHYFVIAFLLKTPLPTLILLGLSSIALIKGRHWTRHIYFWLPAGALFIIASYTRLNIGYRHILPITPFILLWAATSISNWWKHRQTALLLLAIMFWYGVTALRQHPHYLAYFNELIGGSAQAYRYLGDSNLDWGQDLKLLADYVRQNDQESITFSYFGASDPAYYGLDQEPLFTVAGEPLAFSPANPDSGKYAISVSHLQGMVLARPAMFDWFRRQEPAGNLGYSILLYDVPHKADGTWVAHCLDPTPALDDQTYVARLVNQDELRHVYFDCRTSWVFPNDARAGWYILPQGETWPVQQFLADNLQLVYADSNNPIAPPHEIYYWDGQEALAQWLAMPEQQGVIGGNPINLPQLLGETVELYGYSYQRHQWLTIWRVKAPTDVPLTVAAHFYAGAPQPFISDGLGYTSVQWRPGDIFLQIYDFDAETPGSYLETGLYNYLTGERMSLAGEAESGTFVQLPRRD